MTWCKPKHKIGMLRLLICVCIYIPLSTRTGICQDVICKGKYDPQAKELVYPSPEINASFPTGISQFYIYINKQLDITAEEFENLGLITISFTISSTGKAIVRQIKANGIVSPQFTRKVHKAFAKMPRWAPARCGGRSVASSYRLPIYNWLANAFLVYIPSLLVPEQILAAFKFFLTTPA